MTKAQLVVLWVFGLLIAGTCLVFAHDDPDDWIMAYVVPLTILGSLLFVTLGREFNTTTKHTPLVVLLLLFQLLILHVALDARSEASLAAYEAGEANLAIQGIDQQIQYR